jgi:hypothetical protein
MTVVANVMNLYRRRIPLPVDRVERAILAGSLVLALVIGLANGQ